MESIYPSSFGFHELDLPRFSGLDTLEVAYECFLCVHSSDPSQVAYGNVGCLGTASMPGECCGI